MFNPELLNKMFLAASMQRWNDHVRPLPLSELDKQAHKMVIAHILARDLEVTNPETKISWNKLVRFGLFDLLNRVAITDIKPQVFNKLKDTHKAEFNQYVLKDSGGLVATVHMRLGTEFGAYLDDLGKPRTQLCQEINILHAAHAISSMWEYRLIHPFNKDIYSIEDVARKQVKRLGEFSQYRLASAFLTQSCMQLEMEVPETQREGVSERRQLEETCGLLRFIDLCGRLRFQKRWAQSPRVPETSVLGHMLFVAYTTYLCVIDNAVEFDDAKTSSWNHFFAALYHDLPEAMTRDIVSPIKKSVRGLDKSIRDIEEEYIEQMQRDLFDKHKEIGNDLGRFLNIPRQDTATLLPRHLDEFADRCSLFDVKECSDCEPLFAMNIDIHENPICSEFAISGTLIKACDEISAYIEARSSIAHGVTSAALTKAEDALFKKYEDYKIGLTDFGEFLSYFSKLNW